MQGLSLFTTAALACVVAMGWTGPCSNACLEDVVAVSGIAA